MKPSKSFIGLIIVSSAFIFYASGLYTNLQTDSALEIVDFSIIKDAERSQDIPSNPNRSPF